MDGKWTYRNRLKLLIPAYAGGLLLCYMLAFHKTVREYQKYGEFKRTHQVDGSGNTSLKVLEEKKRMLEHLNVLYVTDTVILDRQFLAELDSCCKAFSLELREYKPLPPSDTTGKVWTRMVTVEGRFAGALKMIYVFEQKDPLCRIASVNFKKYRDSRDKKNRLSCSFYVQNLMTHEMP